MSDTAHAATTLEAVTRASRSHLLLVEATGHPSVTPQSPIVELHHVSKAFPSRGRGGVVAVADLTLSVAQASTVLLMGPSGSGKTTVLSLIGCMARPSSGRVMVDGRDVTRLSEELLAGLRRRRIGFVFQKHHLIRGVSALDNVMLPAVPLPEVDGDLRSRAMALLTRFGLQHRARERIDRLSGGEQQRVALARALVNNPPLVIADEPTSHLDTGAARSLLDLMATLRSEGRTVIVASHDPVLCDSGWFTHVVRLRDGRLDTAAAGRCS